MLPDADFSIEEWGVDHPRYEHFLECVNTAAPEQGQFLRGSYFQSFPCYLLVALQEHQVAGFLQFAVMPIGPEANCPPLQFDGRALVEAKIHAFGVAPVFRNRGIGTALQKQAIQRARQLGCYQLASQSSYDKAANYHLKLALGFSVQPVHDEWEDSVFFLMPLKSIPAEE